MSDDLRKLLQPTSECIVPERFAHLSEQDQSHIEKCPRCQTELALYRQFESEPATPEERASAAWIASELRRRATQTDRRSDPWWVRLTAGFRLWQLGSALAAIVAAVGISLVSFHRGEPEFADSRSSGVMRSTAIETVSPSGELAAPPERLVWKPVSGATSYVARVLEVDSTLVWEATTESTEVRLPETVRRQSLPAKTLNWTVAASGANGGQIAASPMQKFWVRGKKVQTGE